jgi:hypothetical protein
MVRQDEYSTGCWIADLPGLLLWMRGGDTGPRLEGIPSWTWASRIGKTKFCSTESLHAHYWETLCSHIAFEERGTLAISSPVRTVWSPSDLVIYRDPRPEVVEPKDEWANAVFTMRDEHDGAMYSILRPNREIVGAAVFDGDVVPEGFIHCLFLAQESTSENFNYLRDAFPEEVRRTMVNPLNEYFHYVLLLLPLSHRPSNFVRVGMGVIADDNWIRGAVERLIRLN